MLLDHLRGFVYQPLKPRDSFLSSYRLVLLLTAAAVLLLLLHARSPPETFDRAVSAAMDQSSLKPITESNAACSFDRSKPPGDLTGCPDSSLFHFWRPRARFIAPEGWMNDPMSMFQHADGSIHVVLAVLLAHCRRLFEVRQATKRVCSTSLGAIAVRALRLHEISPIGMT